MLQLVPFYLLNQITFAFIFLIVIVYIFSKYILPRFVRLFNTRVFISKLYSLEWGLNSPPKPHAFVSLPLQSKITYKHCPGIAIAIGAVKDSNKHERSLEDFVDAYVNGILNYYFPWDNSRMENGIKVYAGNIIGPQCWNNDLPSGKTKTDFTVSYWDFKLAKNIFQYIWVEDKRPFESFFEALVQVSEDIYLEVLNSDGKGLYGGFIIVTVGKEMAFFEIPLIPFDPNGAMDITWDMVKAVRFSGLDLAKSRKLYVDDNANNRWIGDIWHVENHDEIIQDFFMYIKSRQEKRLGL